MMDRFADAIIEYQTRSNPFPGSYSPDANGYQKLVAQRSNDTTAPAVLGFVYALTGNRDKAFEYFEKGYAIEDGDLIQTLRYPALDPLRSDPRYADLMRRLNLPQ